VYIVLDSMYETMSISTELYPNLDLWNANKLYYITLHYITLHSYPGFIHNNFKAIVMVLCMNNF